MADKEIPTVKGRRYAKEKVNTKDTIGLDLPDRNPGRIPSLQRQLTPQKPTDNKPNIPTRSIRPTYEQGLGNPSNRPIPARSKSEEKVPNLSELLG